MPEQPDRVACAPTDSPFAALRGHKYRCLTTFRQNGVPVISYVPASGSIDEWSFDLVDFIKNARDQFSVVQNSWYLTNVFAGFEIWSGGGGLRSDNFCAIVR